MPRRFYPEMKTQSIEEKRNRMDHDFALMSIKGFVSTKSRNKIVFHNQDLGFETLDLGYVLSEEIVGLSQTKHFALRIKTILERILAEHITEHPEIGKILSLSNFGILFEKELKIDFRALLENLSLNNLLMVKWEGEIIDNKLYFLSKEEGVEVDVKNLNYIRI